jgi:hypothetical protein
MHPNLKLYNYQLQAIEWMQNFESGHADGTLTIHAVLINLYETVCIHGENMEMRALSTVIYVNLQNKELSCFPTDSVSYIIRGILKK